MAHLDVIRISCFEEGNKLVNFIFKGIALGFRVFKVKEILKRAVECVAYLFQSH